MLPVKWLGISAAILPQNNVLVKWETTSEQNITSYIVQRSLNGIDFADAGSVLPKTTRSTINIILPIRMLCS